MTSKEALENLGKINLGDNPYCIFEDNLLKNCCKEEYETIKKDLEVLKILHGVFNYKKIQTFIDNMTGEEFFKVKEWLENE